MSVRSQHEIARLAGVSQATVSRVLNGDPQVNHGLRDRVMKVIRDYDYVPDVRAQMLRNNRTETIGLVVHRAPKHLSGDPFFCGLIAFLIEEAGRHGFHLSVDAARTLLGRRSIYEEMLRTRRVDGLILVEPAADDERIARLVEQGFPFVLIGRTPDDTRVFSVDNDNVGAARQATQHFIAQGHRRVGFIGGPSGLVLHEDRLMGYRDALANVRIKVDERLVENGDFTELSGARAMSRLMDMDNPPSAVVCLDDLMALGAFRALRAAKKRIPQDVAILGFNDSPLCPYLDPPLTSVAVDIAGLAKNAAQTLVDLIKGAYLPPRRRIVPSRLVVRKSSVSERK